jgi:spoIIIJ-associated protein
VTDMPVTDMPVDGDPAADLADQADDGDEPLTAEDDDSTGRPSEALLVREGDIAGDYLERLLDIVDFDGDIDLDVEGDRAVVAVIGAELQALVGANGATLDALQELTRLAVQQQTGVRSRLMLDIGGYRARRRSILTDLARSAAEQVRSTGQAVRLDAMNPFERKVVHDAVAVIDGVRSESEGEEPERRVVVSRDM